MLKDVITEFRKGLKNKREFRKLEKMNPEERQNYFNELYLNERKANLPLRCALCPEHIDCEAYICRPKMSAKGAVRLYFKEYEGNFWKGFFNVLKHFDSVVFCYFVKYYVWRCDELETCSTR